MKPGYSFQLSVLFIIILVILAVGATGFFAYRAMTNIVAAVRKEARPDVKLVLLKDIVSDLSEAESSVKTFTLTNSKSDLLPFYEAAMRIENNFDRLRKMSKGDHEQRKTIDSLHGLVEQKFSILYDLQAIQQNNPVEQALEKVYSKIIKPDYTAVAKNEEGSHSKPNVFKRIMSARQEEKKSEAKAKKEIGENEIKNVLGRIKKEEYVSAQKILNKQLELTKKDKVVMNQIRTMLKDMESGEDTNIARKTIEAEKLARQANSLIVVIITAISILLLVLAFSIVRYIRKGREFNIALQKAKDEVENVAKSKDNFFIRMNHEIRTPINAILGFTQEVIKSPLSPQQNQQLQIIKKSGEHLLTIANEILDLSRLEAGKIVLEEIPFQPKELINDVFLMLRQEAENKHLDYILQSDAKIPEVLVGDPFRLKQVVLNILGNAIKFTEKGDVKLSLALYKKELNKIGLSIAVSDTGIGIAANRLNEIFNEFEQAEDSIGRKFGGTGLGLNITKKLCELLNGKIDLKSNAGKGTTVTVQIPFLIGDDKPAAVKNDADLDPKLLKNKYVLVADDNEYNRLLLQTILKNADIKCDEAVNGKLAVELHQKNEYDVILMDLIMPEMSGIEAIRLIRQLSNAKKATVPVIVLTAVGSEDIIAQARQAGADDFLNKPFRENELFKKLFTALQITPGKAQEKSNSALAPNLSNPKLYQLDDLYRTAGKDKDFANEMINVFIRTTKEGIDQIKQSVASKDWENVANNAHKIASPTRHLQALTLLQLIKQIENNARELNDIGNIPSLLEQLEKTAAEVISSLEKEIA